MIGWYILHLDIRGEVDIDEIKLGDLIKFVAKITSRNEDTMTCVKFGRLIGKDHILKRGDNISIIDDDQQERLRLLRTISEMPDVKIPDAKKYNMGIFNMKIYEYKKSPRYELTLFKIIKTENNNMLIKLLHPRQINWGRGPTCRSIYAWINTETKKINPIYLSSLEMEFLNAFPHNNDEDYYGEYSSLDINKCCVCLENDAIVYLYCKTPHLSVCDNCSKMINKCPICREEFISSTFVEII